MRCYDAIIREMEESSAEIKDPCARQTKNVSYLQETLKTALAQLEEMTALAVQKTDILAELKNQLSDDLRFQNESVVMSLRRDSQPTAPGVVYTLMVTTASGNVAMEFNGRQFQSLAELCRLQKVFCDLAGKGVIDYREVSISERDMGEEVRLHR